MIGTFIYGAEIEAPNDFAQDLPVFDTITTTENVSIVKFIGSIYFDVATPSESVTISNPLLQISVAESVSLVDFAFLIQVGTVSFSETISISETITIQSIRYGPGKTEGGKTARINK